MSPARMSCSGCSASLLRYMKHSIIGHIAYCQIQNRGFCARQAPQTHSATAERDSRVRKLDLARSCAQRRKPLPGSMRCRTPGSGYHGLPLRQLATGWRGVLTAFFRLNGPGRVCSRASSPPLRPPPPANRPERGYVPRGRRPGRPRTGPCRERHGTWRYSPGPGSGRGRGWRRSDRPGQWQYPAFSPRPHPHPDRQCLDIHIHSGHPSLAQHPPWHQLPPHQRPWSLWSCRQQSCRLR